jgi:hypothetical protein
MRNISIGLVAGIIATVVLSAMMVITGMTGLITSKVQPAKC